MADAALPILSLFQGGAEDPYKAIALEDVKQYLHIRVNNIVKTYDQNGEMT